MAAVVLPCSASFNVLQRRRRFSPAAWHRRESTVEFDRRLISIREAITDGELLAAVKLRVRTFYELKPSYKIQEYRNQLIEREFEALKDRVSGKRDEFKKVSCVNATIPLSASLADADFLCSACKFVANGKEQVVIGSLDLNQCLWLVDEIAGMKPEGPAANLTRAYLSNVCVAKELHRNGLGYALVAMSKKLAHEWGITDLYVHVAVDNDAAQKLYEKSGFVYESKEPAWQARFLGRPRRYLLWADLTQECL